MSGAVRKIGYLYRRGIFSIALGIIVLLTMIGASFAMKSRNPEETNADYISYPPTVSILRALTLRGKDMSTRRTDGDTIPILKPESRPDAEGVPELPSEIQTLKPDNTSNRVSISEESLPSLGEVNNPVETVGADKTTSSPPRTFIFGTDHLGRDVFVRVVAASKTYMIPCFTGVGIALLLGTMLGIMSGYFPHSWAGTLGNFLQDSIRSIPVFVGMIIVMCSTKIDIMIIMVSFGIFVAPRIAAIVEQQIYSLRQHDFIVAAVEMGIPTLTIIGKHIILYNCIPVLIAQAAFTYAEAVLIETSLGFLGMGAMGSDLSWGFMVKEGFFSFLRGNLWISFFPTMAIIISILSFQALGNGLIKFFDFQTRPAE
ncbi:ABC transporter permease [bacterium]|nr:ABC transporter permease [bacterium]